MQVPNKLVVIALVVVGFAAVACSSSDRESQASSGEPPAPANPAAAASASTVVPAPAAPAAIQNPAPTATKEPVIDPNVREVVDTRPDPSRPPVRLLTDEVPQGLSRGWKTDFSRHSVPYSEIGWGGVPRDGIRPIDSPKFDAVSGSLDPLNDNEPVISLVINGEAKAYPLAILIWHEIVNDELGGVPVTVTYCPLCNTAIVFDRRVDGQILDFGTSGNLRNSDLVMWDRQTESWWQQISGEAIVGSLTGAMLKFIPAPLVSWKDFRESFADGQVLSRDTGLRNDYDFAPYDGYDELNNRPFLFSGQIDNRLAAMERVVGLVYGDEVVAYPFFLFEEAQVVNDTIGGQDIAIFFVGDTLSAFAGSGYSDSRQVGSTGVFDPNLEGQKLTFQRDGDRIVDEQTGSTWNILGQAVDGPLQGSSLDQVVHANHFWFAWSAFNPETEIRFEEVLATN